MILTKHKFYINNKCPQFECSKISDYFVCRFYHRKAKSKQWYWGCIIVDARPEYNIYSSDAIKLCVWTMEKTKRNDRF